MREYDLIIIGGGASGLLSAINGKKDGIENILLIEKDPTLGGALGSADYNISESGNLTGIEYKENLLKEFNDLDIDVKLNTMVLKIEDSNEVLCTSSDCGVEKIKGKNIIIANGGKEKSRNAVQIPGDRTAGVLTVGMAKKAFGIKNIVPGKNIFIVGDSTLYMIQEDLKKHNIKIAGIITDKSKEEVFDLSENLYPGYEIISIHGEGRINSVTIKNNNDEKIIKCDTVMFAYPMISDGLVALRSGLKLNPATTGPEVDKNLETSKKNIYACGNAIYVHKSIEEIEDECKKLVSYLK